MIDLDFGPDGALYVADYGGSNFAINNANNSVRRFAYIGGADTPGPDPKVDANPNPSSTTFAFNIGKSGGVSYKWDFSDGGTATGTNVTHTYVSAGNGVKPTATLTVTYADGQTSATTIDVPVPTTVPSTVTLDVPQTLGLTIGPGATFGGFMPGVTNTYARQHDGERHLDDAERPAGRRRPEHDERRLPGQHRHAAGLSACGCGRRTRRHPNTAFNNITGTQFNAAVLGRTRSVTTRSRCSSSSRSRPTNRSRRGSTPRR